MLVIDEEKRAEVDRILQSHVFRSSEALRRLLRFLADKSLSGEADQLKEYTVGIDAFGKSHDYDPRQDSVVRIQVGRLRQKLSEYYLTDGKDDPIIVELPKGGFKLKFGPRPIATEVVQHAPAAAHAELAPGVVPLPAGHPNRRIAIAMGLVLIGVLGWAVVSTVKLRQAQGALASEDLWTPEIRLLWTPVISGSRPLLVAVSSPLFIGLKGYAYYRDVSQNRWEYAIQDPDFKAVRRALNNPEIFPQRSYTGVGDANAVFLLGKFLGKRKQNVSFAKTSDLSWQQLADSNVILVGTPRSFDDLLRGMPANLEMVSEGNGLRLFHPKSGEPEFIGQQNVREVRAAASPEDGEVYAVITRVPGPNGVGEVESFSSILNSGTLAAVEWFTDPTFARTLVQKLRKPSGELPRYYQIALKVRFKGGVPTETSYVLHRELQPTVHAATP
jgi:hypothetical protein